MGTMYTLYRIYRLEIEIHITSTSERGSIDYTRQFAAQLQLKRLVGVKRPTIGICVRYQVPNLNQHAIQFGLPVRGNPLRLKTVLNWQSQGKNAQ
jgi:hypothetical protein